MELSELKPGDKILMTNGNTETICEVEKIDRYGRIKVNGHEYLFNKYGLQVKKEKYNLCDIRPITEQEIEQLKEKWKRQYAINKAFSMCHNVREKDLTYESAIKIITILSGKMENE